MPRLFAYEEATPSAEKAAELPFYTAVMTKPADDALAMMADKKTNLLENFEGMHPFAALAYWGSSRPDVDYVDARPKLEPTDENTRLLLAMIGEPGVSMDLYVRGKLEPLDTILVETNTSTDYRYLLLGGWVRRAAAIACSAKTEITEALRSVRSSILEVGSASRDEATFRPLAQRLYRNSQLYLHGRNDIFFGRDQIPASILGVALKGEAQIEAERTHLCKGLSKNIVTSMKSFLHEMAKPIPSNERYAVIAPKRFEAAQEIGGRPKDQTLINKAAYFLTETALRYAVGKEQAIYWDVLSYSLFLEVREKALESLHRSLVGSGKFTPAAPV